jgi:hypothetical protein
LIMRGGYGRLKVCVENSGPAGGDTFHSLSS